MINLLFDQNLDNGLAILYSILVLVALGAIFAFLLCLFFQIFKVKEDLRVREVEKKLPGYNCGACGNPGCHDMAEKLVSGEIKDPSLCKPGKKETNFDPIVAYLAANPAPIYEEETKKEKEN